MTPDILASKRHHRYLEHVWHRYPTTLNRSRLTRQTQLCNRQMSKGKIGSLLLLSTLAISGHYGRHLTKSYSNCPKLHLPDHSSITALANTFSSFFIDKISVTHSSFLPDLHSCVLNPPDTRKVLQNLTCVTADEVRCFIPLAPCKSSDLDPIHTRLVNDCNDILKTLITAIINLLLSEGSFPSHFKSALVSPPLKKHTINKDKMKNYRPLSNFSFLSKVFEKVVVNQLNLYINSSNKSIQYQSEYRKFQSTESALRKIHNNIIASKDAGKLTVLTLLDLSTAFDTIEHTILWRTLDDWFGATGKALN